MKIGLLTSGGDAPGMNPAIRAVVRTAIYHNYEVFGIRRGYAGLLERDFIPLTARSVANILQQGGTILQSSRSQHFMTEVGKQQAVEILKEYGIDVLVVIGGDGSLTGALELKRRGVNVIGIPATIDNDFGATYYTIGFNTAVQTAVDAIGKIRDTTISHNRINIVQVMGRKCGDIALLAGISCGAGAVIVPEVETDIDEICEKLLRGKERGKIYSIIMLAEGCGNYEDYCRIIEEKTQITTRGTNLGYIQRGGSPSHYDRLLAGEMGHDAVDSIAKGNLNVVTVIKNGEVTTLPIEAALAVPKKFNIELYEKMKVLSI